jgi:O-methyltransferase
MVLTMIPETKTEPLYYHTIELPDGLHAGQWDCRESVDAYLGRVDFTGKTVLEVGPANGFFSFEMERRGAQVTCLELGENDMWDMVPGPLIDKDANRDYIREGLHRVQAAFWHAHALNSSRVAMKYGSIYAAPERAEAADIGMLGNVLQHLRDPIGGLMAMAECVTETFIVAETIWLEDPRIERDLYMQFIPSAEEPGVVQSWWQLSSPLIGHVLKMLGFPKLRREYHSSVFSGDGDPRKVRHVTWVGERS